MLFKYSKVYWNDHIFLIMCWHFVIISMKLWSKRITIIITWVIFGRKVKTSFHFKTRIMIFLKGFTVHLFKGLYRLHIITVIRVMEVFVHHIVFITFPIISVKWFKFVTIGSCNWKWSKISPLLCVQATTENWKWQKIASECNTLCSGVDRE